VCMCETVLDTGVPFLRRLVGCGGEEDGAAFEDS
jgi:hypothetical protein